MDQKRRSRVRSVMHVLVRVLQACTTSDTVINQNTRECAMSDQASWYCLAGHDRTLAGILSTTCRRLSRRVPPLRKTKLQLRRIST